MGPTGFINNGAITTEEKVALYTRMASIESTLSTVLDRTKQYEAAITNMNVQLTAFNTILTTFQHRYGSGEPDGGLVVRQKDHKLDKERVKALPIEDKDIEKVIISQFTSIITFTGTFIINYYVHVHVYMYICSIVSRQIFICFVYCRYHQMTAPYHRIPLVELT